jgi:PAS domain S-box-containing protein
MLSRHGKLQPVIMLLSSTRISFQGKAHALIMIEDITERKQVEERVVQLNRVRAFLGGVDHAIVHNPDQKKLLDEICRVAVEKGGFKLAWVGFVMPNGIVQPVAKAGVTGYLKDIRVVARKVPEGSGPVGLAIRENRAVISDDIDHDARMAPWHARARQFGLHYCAAFPIRIADKVIGTITLYAPRAGFFDEGEVNLLTMVSDEISFALTAFDVALKRKLAVEALLLSEKELADFFGRSPLGLLWVGPDGRIQRINQAELRLLGRSKKETLGLPIAQFHADPKAIANLLNRLATGATVKDYRTRIRQKDGKIKHVLIDANGLWVNKTLKHSRWFVWDISRRVELEKEILTIGERIQRELGRELHDDLGQQLTSIEFLSQSLAGDLAAQSGNDAARAREIARLVRQTILKTRELSHGLSPVGLETENGLMNTLRALAESIRRIYKIECYFRCSKPVRSLSHTTNIQLFRIAQEAVTNAIKHGKARRIDISLAGSDSKIIIAVKNDGTPLPKNAFARKGIGLHLMQYRAGIIGGSASVQLEPNGRTSAVCIVPASHQIEIERDGE